MEWYHVSSIVAANLGMILWAELRYRRDGVIWKKLINSFKTEP